MAIGLGKIARRQKVVAAREEAHASRAQAILDGANPVQRDLILDPSLYLGLLCPRRAGKTFAMTSKVLHFAEMNPGSRILIISLTLKSTIENYWSGSPGGLFAQNFRYDLGLKFNHASHTWIHENGSRGLLAGAETKADIERLRGAAAEADICILDECKSFSPDHLDDLIENVVEPGLMTRNGILIMGGTPGSIPSGPFYEATCELARVGEAEDARPTCVMWDRKKDPGLAYAKFSAEQIEELYSLHRWTVADNIAAPFQWKRALATKRRRSWDDDHPSWRREYLGEWVADDSDLVYSYARCKAASPTSVTWQPDYAEGRNRTGLPSDRGPWHLVLGLDLGFVDDSAMVLLGYSETTQELRQVHEFKAPGMDAEVFALQVMDIVEGFSQPVEMIVADTAGGGSKMIIEMLNNRLGLAIQPAQKREKQDYIELCNADFNAGRIKLLPGSELETELCGLQWDLSHDSKVILSKTGRLREDPSCPNHLADAFLYIWRFSYHYWARANAHQEEKYTDKWYAEFESKELDRVLRNRKIDRLGMDKHGLRRIRERDPAPMTRESLGYG